MLTERYFGLSFKFFLHFSMRFFTIKSTIDHYKGEIFRLNSENEKLREDPDALEQYGRRELMRINGIPDGGKARPCSPTLTGFPILCDRMILDSLRSGSMDLIRSVTSLVVLAVVSC
jgi:hypothetical protein